MADIVKKILIGLGVAFIIMFIWIITSPTDDKEVSPEVAPKSYMPSPEPYVLPTPDPAKEARDKLEAEMRANFMSGCADEPGYYAYCSCVWTDLTKRYTLIQIMNMNDEMNNSEDLPAGVEESVFRCLNEIEEEVGANAELI